ncbi:MAG: hypothetical protein Fur0041_07790 [Bacteroidia bacterium]
MRHYLTLFTLLFHFYCASQTPQDSGSRDYFTPKAFCYIPEDRGTFYLAFGYNKNYYSSSDIRVHDASGDMDFTLHNMKAHDRPHFNEIFKVAISIPQYGYRLGYWLPGGKYGVEVNFDHAKYIVNDYQTVRMKGYLNGQQYDLDTLVDPDHFLHLEHTDGANFLMANFMLRHFLYRNGFIGISAIGKAGMGVVIPRSDVTLFGQRWNHCFHIAGEVYGIETGFRIELFRYFFLEPTVKGVFCNFRNVLAVDDILISHKFRDGMILLHGGFQFPLGKKK